MLAELESLIAAVSRLGEHPSQADVEPAVESLRFAWAAISEHCLLVSTRTFDGQDQFLECLQSIDRVLQDCPSSAWAEAEKRRVRWYGFLYAVLTQQGPIALREMVSRAAEKVFQGEDILQLANPRQSPP